uniref:Protein Wnt n=1 Tax=Panagrolaimus sp. ES5 TaxID=591445 RepID=A0AC34G7S6_9BILA
SELCRRMTDLMPFVKNAAKETIEMCQEMFKEYRWNCSTIKKAPNFENDLIKASREWADAAWKSKIRTSRDLGPGGEFIWDEDELELLDEQNSILTTPASPRMHEIKGNTEGKTIVMNQQNNYIGRQIVVKSQFQKCKCHGVSSSCQVQTCWSTLPPFKAIAEG